MMLTSRSASRSRRRDAEHWGAPPNSPPPPPAPDVEDVAEARSSEREEVDDYHQGKWVPEAERKKHRKTALERASLAKLHRGRPAYLKALVASAF